MVRDLRGNGMTRYTSSNEALMFSIYYAAITSMEEDDVSSPRVVMPCLEQTSLRILLMLLLAGHDQLWLLQN